MFIETLRDDSACVVEMCEADWFVVLCGLADGDAEEFFSLLATVLDFDIPVSSWPSVYLLKLFTSVQRGGTYSHIQLRVTMFSTIFLTVFGTARAILQLEHEIRSPVKADGTKYKSCPFASAVPVGAVPDNF